MAAILTSSVLPTSERAAARIIRFRALPLIDSAFAQSRVMPETALTNAP